MLKDKRILFFGTNNEISITIVESLIKQNAIKIGGVTINSIDYQCVNNEEFLLQVGKKIAFKIIIN